MTKTKSAFDVGIIVDLGMEVMKVEKRKLMACPVMT